MGASPRGMGSPLLAAALTSSPCTLPTRQPLAENWGWEEQARPPLWRSSENRERGPSTSPGLALITCTTSHCRSVLEGHAVCQVSVGLPCGRGCPRAGTPR
jgi:hypothetical protein